MRIPALIALVTLLLSPASAMAQRRGEPKGPFNDAKGFTCTFSTYAVAVWEGERGRVVPGEDNLTVSFTDVNFRRGVARFSAGAAAVEVTVRLSETGFNAIEQTPAGNFILTTIFAGGGPADRYVAVHSRHLGDLTTPPSASQYSGTCEVVN